MEVYQEESRRIRAILKEYTDLIEPLSLDEAYLDVTKPKKGPPSGTLVARRIREEIYEETGLTASAGVGPSKFVAKVATGRGKPDGLTVVRPEEQIGFIAGLPIGDFHGIGPVTEEKMAEMGIETGADLQETSEKRLRREFGKRGAHFKRLAMGTGGRPVRPDRERKSVGAERTFSDDVAEPEEMLFRLEPVAQRVAGRLREAGPEGSPTGGRTVALKLKSHDHEVSTRQTTLRRTVRSKESLMRLAGRLLQRPHPPEEPVRLLGLSVSSLTGEEGSSSRLISGGMIWMGSEGRRGRFPFKVPRLHFGRASESGKHSPFIGPNFFALRFALGGGDFWIESRLQQAKKHFCLAGRVRHGDRIYVI
jgi:DNA polymerase-4